MKHILTTVILIFLLSCNPKKTDIPSFTITKIKNEKDGKTLFLKNENEEVYTTVISIPNGNFVNVKEGDLISFKIEDTLQMTPPALISKEIKIIN